jgi:hypothetical protein
VWKLEIEKLSLIHAAIAKEKARLEYELSARDFRGIKLWESHLYIVYLKDREAGPYGITDPCPWPKRDKLTLLSLLGAAFRTPAALAVYMRGLLAGKDRSGTLVFPLGRFDLALARRLATPLPAGHPALKKGKKKPPPPVIFYEEIEEEG